jgi:hypothetical protein
MFDSPTSNIQTQNGGSDSYKNYKKKKKKKKKEEGRRKKEESRLISETEGANERAHGVPWNGFHMPPPLPADAPDPSSPHLPSPSPL